MEIMPAVILRKTFSVRKYQIESKGNCPPPANENNKVWEPSFMEYL